MTAVTAYTAEVAGPIADHIEEDTRAVSRYQMLSRSSADIAGYLKFNYQYVINRERLLGG